MVFLYHSTLQQVVLVVYLLVKHGTGTTKLAILSDVKSSETAGAIHNFGSW